MATTPEDSGGTRSAPSPRHHLLGDQNTEIPPDAASIVTSQPRGFEVEAPTLAMSADDELGAAEKEEGITYTTDLLRTVYELSRLDLHTTVRGFEVYNRMRPASSRRCRSRWVWPGQSPRVAEVLTPCARGKDTLGASPSHSHHSRSWRWGESQGGKRPFFSPALLCGSARSP